MDASLSFSIAAVERDTGIGKDTLRVWERRYGFPMPERDAHNERVYPRAQMERLHLIQRLMSQGHRPGRIVPLPLEQLERLCQEVRVAECLTSASADGLQAPMTDYLVCLQAKGLRGLKTALHKALLAQGLAGFVTSVVAPLTAQVGEAWARGALALHEEHLYTECVSRILRQAIGGIPHAKQAGSPSVLLTTIAQEPHGLGLLMVECLLALQGCRCFSLGTQTPQSDIVRAAWAHQVDVVALSFSSYLKPSMVAQSLTELRRALPSSVALWAGGQASALRRSRFEGVMVMQDLDSIAQAVAQWRGMHRPVAKRDKLRLS